MTFLEEKKKTKKKKTLQMVRTSGEVQQRPRQCVGYHGIHRQTRCAVRNEPKQFFLYFFLVARKVMPYKRQRRAATQVMQNLGDGTSPEGEGQVRRS